MTAFLIVILVAFAITTWFELLIRFYTPPTIGIFAVIATTMLISYTVVVDRLGVFTGMTLSQITTVLVCYFVLGGLATVLVIAAEAAMRAVFIATVVEDDDEFYGDPDVWKNATTAQRDVVLNQLREVFVNGGRSKVELPATLSWYNSSDLNRLIAEIVSTPILTATIVSFFFWPVFLLCEAGFRALIIIEDIMEGQK